jgi:hypothetical protein
MDNFIIVLFKNKKKRKIIKGYKTEKKALEKFNKLIDENKVIFDVRFENSEPCNYELVLLSTKDNYQEPLFKTDELGRNKKVFISNNSEYTIKKVSDFKIEEYIFDVVQNKKISFNEFTHWFRDRFSSIGSRQRFMDWRNPYSTPQRRFRT